MPKPGSIQINIPDPCSQNWEEMSPSQQGRFCAHCQKHVIDFTSWSDTALYNYLSKNNSHVCGRLLSTQVDRPVNIPYQPHSRLYRITIALGLTLLFTQTPHLLAQNRPPKVEQSLTPEQGDPKGLQPCEIKGKIFDDRSDPLPSAVVQVFKDGVLKGGAATDMEGYYSIKLSTPGSYDILVLYMGYDSVTVRNVQITQNAVAEVDAAMTGAKIHHIIMGGINLSKPLNNVDNPTKTTLTRKEIKHMPY